MFYCKPLCKKGENDNDYRIIKTDIKKTEIYVISFSVSTTYFISTFSNSFIKYRNIIEDPILWLYRQSFGTKIKGYMEVKQKEFVTIFLYLHFPSSIKHPINIQGLTHLTKYTFVTERITFISINGSKVIRLFTEFLHNPSRI